MTTSSNERAYLRPRYIGPWLGKTDASHVRNRGLIPLSFLISAPLEAVDPRRRRTRAPRFPASRIFYPLAGERAGPASASRADGPRRPTFPKWRSRRRGEGTDQKPGLSDKPRFFTIRALGRLAVESHSRMVAPKNLRSY
jgi:hypothetical protein